MRERVRSHYRHHRVIVVAYGGKTGKVGEDKAWMRKGGDDGEGEVTERTNLKSSTYAHRIKHWQRQHCQSLHGCPES